MRALVGAAVLACATACVPFGTDANPTRTREAPATQAPSATVSSTPPAPTPSSTASAYPALGPLPDGVAPTRPAALDQPPTLDGAKSVATYFLLLFSYVYQTGDLEAWNTLSDPQCTFCSETAADVQQQKSSGRHVVGGNLDVSDLSGTEVDVAHFFEIKAVIHETRSQGVDTTGTVIDEFAAGGNTIDMVVLFENGTWKVRGVDHKALTE